MNRRRPVQAVILSILPLHSHTIRRFHDRQLGSLALSERPPNSRVWLWVDCSNMGALPALTSAAHVQTHIPRRLCESVASSTVFHRSPLSDAPAMGGTSITREYSATPDNQYTP
jgi:hypothetical protein